MKKLIKPRFMEAGITSCEVKYEGCTGKWATSFAHSKKRKKISTPEEMEEVVIACISCHTQIEAMGHEPMAELIKTLIKNRVRPVKSIYD